MWPPAEPFRFCEALPPGTARNPHGLPKIAIFKSSPRKKKRNCCLVLKNELRAASARTIREGSGTIPAQYGQPWIFRWWIFVEYPSSKSLFYFAIIWDLWKTSEIFAAIVTAEFVHGSNRTLSLSSRPSCPANLPADVPGHVRPWRSSCFYLLWRPHGLITRSSLSRMPLRRGCATLLTLPWEKKTTFGLTPS